MSGQFTTVLVQTSGDNSGITVNNNATYYSYNAYKRAYENHSLPQWGSVQYPDPNTTGSTTSMAMTTPSGILITIHNPDGTTSTIDKYRGLGYKYVEVDNVNGTYSAEIGEHWVDSPDFVPKFDSQGNPIESEYGAGTWVMPPMHVSEDIPTHPGYTAHVNVEVVWSATSKSNFPGLATIDDQGKVTTSNTGLWQVLTTTQSATDIGSQFNVDVTYTANPNQETATVNYVDTDEGNKVVKTGSIQGTSGSTVTITPELPANYELDGNAPTSYTFTADKGQTVTIKIKYQKSAQTSHKTVTRTINITKPGEAQTTTTQTAQLSRTITTDKVTNKTSYTSWTVDNNGWTELTVPTVSGYTTTATVPAVVVNGDTKDTTVNVTYTPNPQTGKISYVDGSGKEIGTTSLSGNTDSQVTITPKAPAGWKITSGQTIPTSVTATATGIPTVKVKVEHATVTVSPDHPKTTSDTLPDNPGKNYPAGVDKDSLNKTVTRTINITKPGQTKPTTQTQTVTFTRTATVDEETGTVTSYGDWSENGTHTFNGVTVPTVAGYTASGTVDPVTVTPNSTSSTVNISYTANPGTQTIQYVDNGGNVIGSQTINGHTDDDIKVTPQLPTGWTLAKNSGMPDNVTIKPSDTPIKVTIQHGSQEVQPTSPVKPGDKTPTGQVIDGGHQGDLNQTITRTITVNTPNVKTSTIIKQNANLTRVGHIDTVTGHVTYDPWTTDGSSWSEYDVPAVPGYTPSQKKVDSVIVKDGQQASTVKVTYTANDQTTHVVYKDAGGNVIKSDEVDGKTDQTVETKSTLPAGWKIADNSSVKNVPTQITFHGASTPDITIMVDHAHQTITPDQPIQSGQKTPDGKTVINGGHATDLNQTITRTVNITDPHTHQTSTTTQTAHISRTGDLDEVTGVVTYNPWTTDTGDWTEVDVPVVPGYTPSQTEVPAVNVTDGQKSQTINIIYRVMMGRKPLTMSMVMASTLAARLLMARPTRTSR